MRLAALAQSLRDRSERFGVIHQYLSAAGDLDRAHNAFTQDADLDTLRVLNAAVARAEKLRKEAEAKTRPTVVK